MAESFCPEHPNQGDFRALLQYLNPTRFPPDFDLDPRVDVQRTTAGEALPDLFGSGIPPAPAGRRHRRPGRTSDCPVTALCCTFGWRE